MSKNATRHIRRKAEGKVDKRESRVLRGEMENVREVKAKSEPYNLSWFKPANKQPMIVTSMEERDLTIVDAPSGTGKTSTVLWKALKELSEGRYDRILFIKNPTEAGDDIIGSLPGEIEDKMAAHIAPMKSIFLDFMPSHKLEYEIKSGRIAFAIPNYQLGVTFYNTLVIIDEAQTMSPGTVKLLVERCGSGSRVVLIGDSKQRYSAKKREDGFRDLINRVTGPYHNQRESKHDLIGYIRMETSNNMRSDLSRLITEIYELEDDTNDRRNKN